LPQKRKKHNDKETVDNYNNNNTLTVPTNNEDNHKGKNMVIGKWTSAWRGSRRYGGWSPEGLNQFNKLVKMVIQDRENNKHFQAQYKFG